jgi:hypothetical protein
MEVVFTHLYDQVTHADVVDHGARNRSVGRRARDGAGGEIFPAPGVVLGDGVYHAAVHAAVVLDPGHHDPHQLILRRAGRRAKISRVGICDAQLLS